MPKYDSFGNLSESRNRCGTENISLYGAFVYTKIDMQILHYPFL